VQVSHPRMHTCRTEKSVADAEVRERICGQVLRMERGRLSAVTWERVACRWVGE
jgi:hypothetical protein